MVDLDEFITNTLKSIEKGVSNSKEGKKAYLINDSIEFDLSVSINEQSKGNIKSQILVLNSNIEGQTTNVNYQRVKFKILPYDKYEEDPTWT